MECVDKRQRVGLKLQLLAHHSDRATGCFVQAVRFRKQTLGHMPNAAVRDPVPALHVQTKEVRVKLLSFCDEVAHEDRSDLSAEQANGVEKCGEGQNPLRLR